MLIVQIDGLDAQAAQAGLASLADVLGFAVDPDKSPVFSANIPKFRGEHDLSAMSLYCSADQFLISSVAVNIRGIEKRHTQIECAVNYLYRFVIITGAVKIGHSHAAQAEAGHGQSAAAEFAFLHNSFLPIFR